MTLADLRAEYKTEVIGPRIYGEVTAIARQVARSYDPRTYASAATWADGLDDLLQEVILERLLGEGQLAYAMATAADADHWRALVARQVKRALAKRRQRTVVDNLLERADELLSRPPFVSSGPRKRAEYWLEGRDVEMRRPTERELRSATNAAAAIPVVRGTAVERAPMVYTTAALERLLHEVATALPASFTRGDLDTIFRGLLTQWLAADLVAIEGAMQLPSEGLTPEEHMEVNDIATRILEGAGQEGRFILRAKLRDMSDGAIAAELGISRPTVAARKSAVFDRVHAELADLPRTHADAVVAALSLALANARWSES